MKEIIDSLMVNELQTQKLKGLSVGVIYGKNEYTAGIGKINNSTSKSPTDTTIFELASIGKLFTAALFQMEVSRNRVKYDDLISDHLAISKISFPKTGKATLLELATHTSGFPSIPESMINKMIDFKNPYAALEIQDLHEYLENCNQNKEPGEYEYSNFGMGLLGYILELKHGLAYEQMIKQEICNRLNMKNTTITLSEEQKENLAQGFDEAGKETPVWTDKVLTGAGSFLSNVADMLKFIKANLNLNYSTLSPQLIECHKVKAKDFIGIGWHIESIVINHSEKEDILWHNGGAGGYFSFIAINKKHQCGVIAFTNSAKDITDFGFKLITSIIERKKSH